MSPQYRRPNDNVVKRRKVTDVLPRGVQVDNPAGQPRIHDPLWRQALETAAEYPYPDPDEALAEPQRDPTTFMVTNADVSPFPIEKYSEDTPWGQMEGESASVYEKFNYYRSLGSSRTQVAVAQHFSMSTPSVNQLTKKFNWHRRVRAWDEHREKLYTVELVEGTKAMAHRHAEIAAKGIQSLATVFEAIGEKMNTDPEGFLQELTSKDAKQLITIAQRSAAVLPNLMNAERLSRGLPTEISASLNVNEHRITVQTRDELAEIAFGLAEVLGGSEETPVIDVRGGDEPAGEDADS